MQVWKLGMVAGAAALALAGCGGSDGDRADGGTNSQAVAFMADVHFQDVYGDLKNSSFKGVPTANGMFATIRTMYAQLTSTRLFNENYFAFRAALDDSLAKGVKLVAFPGDFSDDGQPLNVNGFRAVLAEYEKKGMRFFIAPGNHDPVAPYDDDEKGKDDFMAANGSTVKVYAKNYQGCLNAEANVVCTDQLMEQGYASLLRDLAPYGLMPNEKDVYWETPYSTYAQDKYSYAEAARQAQLGQRSYEICKEGEGGRFKQAGYTNCTSIADVSYLVEPVKGLWLLSVDANVFVPDKLDPAKPNSPKGFTGAGNAGWNKMTTHKKSVMAWIESVSARAKAQGKQLVAFSHYPTMDFYANQTDAIKAAFKPGAFQTARVPEQATAEAVAATGLPLHIGGHMHFNGTNDYLSKSGKYLVNVQSPSLAVYGAAYKIVRFDTPRKVDVQTVALNNVPRFNELFPLYEMEWKYVEGSSKPEDAKRRWDKAILSSTSYGDFTSRYFGELSRLRFLDEYWACDMKDLVSQLNLQQMLTMAQLDTKVTYAQLAGLAAQGVAVPFKPSTGCLQGSPVAGNAAQWASDWSVAENAARAKAQAAGVDFNALANVSAYTFYGDFHRTVYAGGLSLNDMGKQRVEQYRLLMSAFPALTSAPQKTGDKLADSTPVGQPFQYSFKQVFSILKGLGSGKPSDHFSVDFDARTLRAEGSDSLKF
ncbi:metallophosphoesterase family protein [Delftia acidovorans]|uniref:metallophosphoesterase family protein n=1 Tax=Delftia acidovorans TaxID=80866 RepID=UPI000BE2DA87|nr:metallophosphoesterase [Delftia acidovorans]